MVAERKFLLSPENFSTFRDWLKYGGEAYFPRERLGGIWQTLREYPDHRLTALIRESLGQLDISISFPTDSQDPFAQKICSHLKRLGFWVNPLSSPSGKSPKVTLDRRFLQNLLPSSIIMALEDQELGNLALKKDREERIEQRMEFLGHYLWFMETLWDVAKRPYLPVAQLAKEHQTSTRALTDWKKGKQVPPILRKRFPAYSYEPIINLNSQYLGVLLTFATKKGAIFCRDRSKGHPLVRQSFFFSERNLLNRFATWFKTLGIQTSVDVYREKDRFRLLVNSVPWVKFLLIATDFRQKVPLDYLTTEQRRLAYDFLSE